MSPQQAAGVPAHATDDVYALGALLLFLATGAEPSQAPRPDRPLDRPLELLNPDLDPALARVISRCLVPDRASRFQQASDVDSALAAMQAGSPTLRARRRDDAAPDTGVDAPGYRQLSQALGDSICAAALGDPDSEGLTWVSDHPLAKGIGARDLNVGAAGTLLALAQLVDALDDPVHRDTLRRGANLLACSPTQAGLPLPGLFVGESGVAAALLRAGQVLGDAALVDAAVRASRNVSRQPYDSPDLFNGAAGRLLVHLLCWDETGEPVDLDAARAAGEHLLRTSQPTDDGFGIRWPIPPGFGGMSGQSYLGFAHGVAGIADVLVDLGEATGDDRFAAPVRAAVDTLERTASSCLDDDTGLSWPSTEGGETAAAFWCHGAAGIGTFLIDAGTTPKAAGLARGAMHATARGTRWSSPTRCHGLAGSAEALLDAYQRTGDVHLLKALREIGTLLAAYVTPSRLGLTAPSESTAVVTPDYNLGFAGVATTFLRLSDPDHRPRDLSRAGFRFRSTSVLVHEPQETSAL